MDAVERRLVEAWLNWRDAEAERGSELSPEELALVDWFEEKLKNQGRCGSCSAVFR